MSGGQVDYVSLEKLVAHQLAGEIDGLVPVGTTGESPTLSSAEHIEVVRATVKAAGGKVPVYAGAGSNSTEEAVNLAREAEAAGADGALVVAPYYNKPNEEGLFRHFSAIAEATEKPIILYSIPSRCGIEISVDVTARLFEKYPHVCCMKAAEGSCQKVIDYARALGPDFAVMSGDDGLSLPFMSLGATGVISVASNWLVTPIVEMVRAANNNDYAAARKAFLRLSPFFKAIFLEPNPAPIKHCLRKAGIITSDEVRLPLVGLNDATRATLDALMAELSPA